LGQVSLSVFVARLVPWMENSRTGALACPALMDRQERLSCSAGPKGAKPSGFPLLQRPVRFTLDDDRTLLRKQVFMTSVADDEFHLLMERLRVGCPDAAREMVSRYGGHVRRVVRRRLNQSLRRQYDSIDFMQDVWASFFTVPPEKYVFKAPDALVGFLAELAYRRVTDAYRRGAAVKRSDLECVRPLDREDPDRDLPVRGPTPSQFAMANERWENLLKNQPDRIRLLLEMLRQGHSQKEIAERTGLHPKLIQRYLHRIAEKRGRP
jgi:RNA polymerase sigma factor (sigma-70 family)